MFSQGAKLVSSYGISFFFGLTTGIFEKSLSLVFYRNTSLSCLLLASVASPH